jgi:iron complex transport system permease protein
MSKAATFTGTGLSARLLTLLRRYPAWILGIILVALILLTAQTGAVSVGLPEWLSVLAPNDGTGLTGGAYVLWNLRLPRIMLAICVGAALGLAGTLTQGLFRNPLADPGLLGVTSGAAAMAALTIVVVAEADLGIPPTWRYWLLPVSAFGGAVFVCLALDKIARWVTVNSIAGLLLTGIALNAMAAALIGLCSYMSTDEQLRNLTFWTMGSLSGANWTIVIVLAAFLAYAIYSILRLMHAMNALALGESAAAHVGIDVRHLRKRVIILVALLSGFAVAWCGIIGFIGLIAPHIVRTLVGPDQRHVAPLSMLTGAMLLLIADTVARTIAIPAEVPVGIFTALLGAPFFLMLLAGVRHRAN